ncbi:hypothetical protein [Streptomyces sp. NPDC007074]|uniref:hypothetical protein n=1 Tax=Streptomyces sp. NPDC007074 TaxID=3156764 RepID=UPI0033DB3279
MKDRTATVSMAPHPGDFVHQAAPISTTVVTPNGHYARMRCAEQAARSLSVRLTVRRSVGAISREEFTRMRAAEDSFYLLAAAYRQAAHRMERGQRLRNRVSGLLSPLHRVANSVRRVRNERRVVNV